MCIAPCPYPPSSSPVFRLVRAKIPPLAFSMHPSSILANRLDPQPRTKDDDEERERIRTCYTDTRVYPGLAKIRCLALTRGETWNAVINPVESMH
jgi:hypothetical protein